MIEIIILIIFAIATLFYIRHMNADDKRWLETRRAQRWKMYAALVDEDYANKVFAKELKSKSFRELIK